MSIRTFCLLGSALAFSSLLSACSDSPKPGSANVEMGSLKGEHASGHQGTPNGDSLTAGLSRDTSRYPTGKQIYKNASRSADQNHDGVAD
ncbi:hypothetical protein GCM10023172_29720 [Hymenobacter ginsengisoli]|uniref:Lipoprotein n=1 Tax=Hymenobacter ginsengisoli TaxID=1051626 RepID=A0ABP8QK48_9BACT|nr:MULTISPECIES: hypothetical protein [unclassified Hymenobacter]MBO2029772.1 hypothetical protein [Hymenobacter sp. BT559]